MKDCLVKIITDQVNVRALACITTDLVNEACRRHNTSHTASAALGRVLTGEYLIGGLLKSGQRVALKFEDNGPIKKIIAEADSEGHVRGYVGEPTADLPFKDGKLCVDGPLGKAGLILAH